MKQDRLKSKAMWVAIIAQVVVILSVTGILPQTDIEILNAVGLAILEIVSLFGIVNSPTTRFTITKSPYIM